LSRTGRPRSGRAAAVPTSYHLASLIDCRPATADAAGRWWRCVCRTFSYYSLIVRSDMLDGLGGRMASWAGGVALVALAGYGAAGQVGRHSGPRSL
jgi:hypothetical protein